MALPPYQLFLKPLSSLTALNGNGLTRQLPPDMGNRILLEGMVPDYNGDGFSGSRSLSLKQTTSNGVVLDSNNIRRRKDQTFGTKK